MTVYPVKTLSFLILLALASSCDRRPADEPRAEQRATPIKAEVTAYENGASLDHFDDGSFEVFDSLQLKILEPKHLVGESLHVLVEPEELPPDSPLRSVGTQCTFELNLSHLDADQLFWGALENVLILNP